MAAQPNRNITMIQLGILVGLILFVADVIAVHTGYIDGIDHTVLQWFRVDGNPDQAIGPPWFEEAAAEITTLGSYTVVIIVCLITTGVLLSYRLYAASAFIAVSLVGGALISSLLKLLFERPRPDIVEHLDRTFTYSFPSGHALISSVTYLTLAAVAVRFVERRQTRRFVITCAFLLAALVGISRVYLGVHWPSDVFAGWCLGGAWAGTCWYAAHWLTHRNRPSDETEDLGRSHTRGP
ncbi:phosphatase PAP2 family protein [Rhizobium sp. L1K21]|uniref:phosphatase PAP2 family protein n=1 Tax=Rhizobium sp. L1K21 TaxID=2954933 RepID=UPI002093AF3B|nr:phosphatase PAP2 family protein [Rhizobium sp. L1K21]MCO6188329.1 phosphatase PAP2 family protein [Rhizobium sp. L1K21]